MGGFIFICVNGSFVLNGIGNNMIGNDLFFVVDEFEDKMSIYVFYYLYIVVVVLVVGYL